MPKPLPIPPKPFQSIGDVAEEIIRVIERRREQARRKAAPPPIIRSEDKDNA